MAAAASAAQNGAVVILLEKTAAVGGNTLASGCAWNAADPELQGKIPTMSGQVKHLKGVLAMDKRISGSTPEPSDPQGPDPGLPGGRHRHDVRLRGMAQ
jgi:flavin-dependent dehydrogenase